MIGVNLSGAEFGSGNRYGYDYIYPSENELDFYNSKGVDLIRLPFKWERMQSNLGSELNQTELARMKTFLAQADERGMKVVIDLHNYGRYAGQAIGTDKVPVTSFADFWQKLAGELKGSAALAGYDLMNEPHDMGSSTVWPTAAQAAVNAIRSADMSTAIYVQGDGWSGAQNWLSGSNKSLHIKDPANNIVYEAHLYFDRYNSGTYKNGYDAEGAYADVGVNRVQPFLDWLEQNNYKGFIGEFSVPNNDPRWLPVLDKFLGELQAHGVSGTYWGAGSWWGDYPMALRAKDGSGNPQLDIVSKYVSRLATNDIIGTDKADILGGTSGIDVVKAGAGNDIIIGTEGADRIDGSYGLDTVTYALSSRAVAVDLSLAVQTGSGDAAGDRLVSIENVTGSRFADKLVGDKLANLLNGEAGNDILVGQDGNDILQGGGGSDQLSGGTGADRFVFASVDEIGGTRNIASDIVMDMKKAEGDRLDFSQIDAKLSSTANDAFTFIGSAAFNHMEGQLRFEVNGKDLHVQGDVNGDGVADFDLLILTKTSLLASELVL